MCVGVCDTEEELWEVLTETLSSISPSTAFLKTSTHLRTKENEQQHQRKDCYVIRHIYKGKKTKRGKKAFSSFHLRCHFTLSKGRMGAVERLYTTVFTRFLRDRILNTALGASCS